MCQFDPTNGDADKSPLKACTVGETGITPTFGVGVGGSIPLRCKLIEVTDNRQIGLFEIHRLGSSGVVEARRRANTKAKVRSLPAPSSDSFSEGDFAACLRVLQAVSEDTQLVNQHVRFKGLVAKIHREGKRARRNLARQAAAAADRMAIKSTELVRQTISSKTPSLTDDQPQQQRRLQRSRRCYVCKQPYTELHHFYHQLCAPCASLNWDKRQQRADLSDRVALITGGRVKIGFQTALKLLRDNARVLVTTRFPQDAAKRFQAEADFAQWKNRLEIYALDLRNVPSVEQFATELVSDLPSLDILIHNAAQTVKRPLAFYQHLLETICDDESTGLIRSGQTESVLLESRPEYQGHLPGVAEYFPLSCFDADGQQLDTRPINSWMLKIGQVGTIEMLEVYLVNTAAPFILTSKLKPLLSRSPHGRRFVINVSAMEGQFARKNKTAFHPHTNMAKAALNMLTRTCAEDLATEGIFINSVDTGWITDEKPVPLALQVRERDGFYAPLDIIDGASRVYDPIAGGCDPDVEPLYGHFLKNYLPHSW